VSPAWRTRSRPIAPPVRACCLRLLANTDCPPYDEMVVTAEATLLPSSPSPAPSTDVDWCQRFEKLQSLHLPDLTGKTVLDVSAFDGYFSFAAERFGASRVLTVDVQRPAGKDSFEYVRRSLASRVENLEMDVLDISPQTVGRFDVVLFLDVLHHMRHPLLSLEGMASVTRELLVVDTHVDMTFLRSPAIAFYPPNMRYDDANWCGPNRAAVLGMLRSVGFKKIVSYPRRRLTVTQLVGLPSRVRTASERMSATPWGSRQRVVKDFARNGLKQNRLVTHSWR
jgi:tRNA (mo5U34)-methyltransferase